MALQIALDRLAPVVLGPLLHPNLVPLPMPGIEDGENLGGGKVRVVILAIH